MPRISRHHEPNRCADLAFRPGAHHLASRPRWRSEFTETGKIRRHSDSPVRAATPGAEGDEVSDLDQLKPEALWAAPLEWCPNTASTISFRVVGNSMSPLILDGYIIAVDTSDIARDNLIGQIVVARNMKENRLLVSRLIRFDHTDALVSDQRDQRSVLLGNDSSWRIVGRVLWWTGKTR
jgi:hypothetical protein